MRTEVCREETPEVKLADARSELDRLLSDARFRASDRQRDILRYLAERRFSGCRESIKAYSIALDVLGRSSDFDATFDPIVRIEISRLRTALDGYYSVFGPDLGMAIHIPKGSYVTTFPASPVLDGNHGRTGNGDVEITKGTPAHSLHGRKRLWRLSVVAAAVAAVTSGLALMIAGEPVPTSKPIVRVSMVSAAPEYSGDAGVTRDKLLIALTQFDTVVVTTADDNAAVRHGLYEVNLKYYADSDDRSIVWQVIDTSDNHLIMAGMERVSLEGKVPTTARFELVGAVARKIASARGVINSVIAREAPANSIGNTCVARAVVMLDGGDDRERSAITRCLERTLALDSEDPDASAALARVYAQLPEKAAESLELAGVAVSIAPLSDRSHVALMAARFANGRLDAALDAGNKALSLNPYNASTAATLSFVLFSGGYWQAAADMAHDVAAVEDMPPNEASLVLALDAYRNGRWSDASLLAEQAVGSDLLTRSIRAAALGELGAIDASRRLKDATGIRNDFEGRFRQAAKAAGLRADLVNSLEAGLAKAGAKFDADASISKP